jgi:hypothetical protein
MGIEPTREVVPDLENKQFGAITNAKCDGRVNFRGTWGHVGIHRGARPWVVPTNNKSLTGSGAVSGKGGSPSRKATFPHHCRCNRGDTE